MDVLIRRDTGTDLLDTFGLEFRITSSGGGRFEFVNPPTDPQLTDPEYVLAGDSLFALFPPAGAVITSSELNDTYIGGDATISMIGVSVPTTGELLARLEVSAATSNPPEFGESFTVNIEPTLNTFFYDPNFYLDPESTPIDFSSTSGTVRMAIPEPSSLIIWALMGLSVAGIGWRQCRKLA